MKKGVMQFTACCLAAGMTFSGTGIVSFAAKDTVLAGLGSAQEGSETAETAAEEKVEDTEKAEETEAATEAAVQETEPVRDTSMSGEMAFAQCEEYINVRSDASADSEVVGKVYNNGSVTILAQVGDWYEVQSGNASGYVKAEFFATGVEAEAIAQEVAYNVATVYPEALMVRSDASEDSEAIGTVYSSDELEVVQYEGDWMKVALGGDSYGYVNANYVGYDTYYGTAETLEEEQARLDAEWLAYLAEQEAQQRAAEEAYLAEVAAQEQAAQQAAWDAEYQASQETQQTTTVEEPQEYWEPEQQVTTDAQAEADAAYQEYLAAQQAADEATQYADEQAVYDTAAQAQEAYEKYLAEQAEADLQAAGVTTEEPTYEEPVYEEPTYEEPTYEEPVYEEPTYEEPTYEEPVYEEPTYEEPVYEEPTYEEPSYSSTGQAIVDFAVQFVGNPYVWGGTSLTNGADCSGFTQSVFANFGISIPRTAASQSGSGTPVDLSEIQAGDLLFYSGDGGIGHVTIYMGNGQVVHASNSSTGIIISDYGYRTPVSARRYW